MLNGDLSRDSVLSVVREQPFVLVHKTFGLKEQSSDVQVYAV